MVEHLIYTERVAGSSPAPSIMNLSVIYQDNDIIAVNKPAGIAVHKGVAEKGETLADWLVEKFRK